MNKNSDDKIQFANGLLCSLKDLGNGKSRLSFDDLTNDTFSQKSFWKIKNQFVYKDYDNEFLENFKFPKYELVEIAQVILTRLLAKNQKKTDRPKLIWEIRQAFKDAEFPYHMGLIAAESVDDWISDENVLKELTEKYDFHGEWWDIPESHLNRGSLGLNYLDSTGLAFYLPAFMTLALKKPEYKYFNGLIEEFNPVYEGEYEDLYASFCDKFSKIKGKRKEVCIKFMKYMKEMILLAGHVHICEVLTINEALKHEFWRIDDEKNKKDNT